MDDSKWDRLKGKVKRNWAQITDEELTEAGGDYDRAVGIIQQQTGETAYEIEEKLDDEYRPPLDD